MARAGKGSSNADSSSSTRPDEHHNGTQLVDLDRDGDLDIISIGWNHQRVIVYENLVPIQNQKSFSS